MSWIQPFCCWYQSVKITYLPEFTWSDCNQSPVSGLFTPPPSPHRCPAPFSCHTNRCWVFPEPLRSHRHSCPWHPQCNAAGGPAALVEDAGRDSWHVYPRPPAGAGGGAWRTVCRGVSRCQQTHWGWWNKPLTWKLTDQTSVDLGFTNLVKALFVFMRFVLFSLLFIVIINYFSTKFQLKVVLGPRTFKDQMWSWKPASKHKAQLGSVILMLLTTSHSDTWNSAIRACFP